MRVENLLLSIFISLFIILFVAQAILVKPSFGLNISLINEGEGLPLKNEEFLYKRGELVLKCIGDVRKEHVKILINGDEKDSFSAGEIKIDVKQGDVIEIDISKACGLAETNDNKTYKSNEINLSVDIIITSVSDNITSNYSGQKLHINSKVQKIIQVKIK